VTYGTIDGTALAGEDYNGIVSQTVTFNAGESSKEVHVTVLGEWQDDPKKLNRLGY